MRDMDTPAWVKDAVFYQIFPDRFAKSERVAKPAKLEPWDSPPTVHGYKGGDLLGVVEKLDYLQTLGVNALYFNPIFQSASNHRYHTYDYTRVDPMLGGNEALRELLDAAHARGMRVVLDGVFNHASRGFFQFHDILENGVQSPYLDWFYVHRFPLNAYGGEGGPGYEAWWGLPALPKFNTDNEAVREFLWGVATHWLEFGIDGWRLDVPNEIDDDEFWREFRRRCRRVNPECYIVGEIWDDASRWLQGDQFDAVMNYPFTRAIFGFVAEELNEAEIKRCGYQHIPTLDAEAFAWAVHTLLTHHPSAATAMQLNLLGSHDTPRALTVLKGDEAALRMALMFLLTFPGAPCLYYGDELGLMGGHDPECRQAMPWGCEASWNHRLLDYTRELIALRHQHRALRDGYFATLYGRDGLYLYLRQGDGESFIGALNRNGSQSKLLLPLDSKAPEGHYRDVMGALSLEVDGGHARGFDLPARSATLYRLER
jgi:neopullulanase